jgi:dipeptidyl-peptidase-4
MKKLLLLLSVIAFTQLIAQKELTLNDAVLGYQKGLFPQGVKQLGWLKDVDKYYYATDSSYIIKNAKDCEIDIELRLWSFQRIDTNIKRLPYLKFINKDILVFSFQNEFYWVKYSFSDFDKSFQRKVELPSGAQNAHVNIESKQVIYTLDNNLYLATSDNEKIAITSIKDKNIVSGQAIHRYEFGISEGIFWSPDGSKIAFYQKDETDVADYPLLDNSTTPGTLKSIKYPMAGQKSEYAKVGVYDIATKKLIYLKTTGTKDSYLTNLTWGPNSDKIYLAQLNRGQNDMRLNEYDAVLGNINDSLIHVTNDKWVEPEYPIYFNPKNNNEFLWISEKDDFQAVYKFNLKTKLLKQVTTFEFPIVEVLGYNPKGDYFFFTATGKDGRNKLGYRLDVVSGKTKLVTDDEGVHNIGVSYSGNYISDSYSTLTLPKKVLITDIKKNKKTTILESKNPLIDYTTAKTSFLTLRSKDGFDLYGRTILPHNFDETKKYPVLVYAYGGPHAQLVKNQWLGGASLWMHWMANQGYIVFTLDGRGSANRGFEFENVIHRELGKNEMEDQLVGVDYLKSLPYVDTKRIAVHGWSFGGFMTTSLMLKHPDVFTTGVAGGPVMDWKWYEIMYGERYMDTPKENPEGYKRTSTLNYVKKLKGKLLTIHGSIDDVVVMQHNLAFLQKCVDEGVQTDFYTYPMHPHNVRGKDRVHLMTKVLNYIIEHNK